jgi:tetratricopeptide (TPR) repeat protein
MRTQCFWLRVPFVLLVLSLTPHLRAQDSWENVRGIAESQHEIVMLMIQQERFDTVFEASRKIFELQFPPEQEHLLVKEAEILTDALLMHDQTEIAHQVLDCALLNVSTNQSKAALHREKAYVFKKEGKTEEAMKHFQKSIELEKGEGAPGLD